jgi:hypothetical protein
MPEWEMVMVGFWLKAVKPATATSESVAIIFIGMVFMG